MRRGLIRGVGRSTKPDADILRCYADDEGENDRSLITTDTKTRPLKPGMTCQIELRLIHLISHAASMLCRLATDDETRRESATRCHASHILCTSPQAGFPRQQFRTVGRHGWAGRKTLPRAKPRWPIRHTAPPCCALPATGDETRREVAKWSATRLSRVTHSPEKRPELPWRDGILAQRGLYIRPLTFDLR